MCKGKKGYIIHPNIIHIIDREIEIKGEIEIKEEIDIWMKEGIEIEMKEEIDIKKEIITNMKIDMIHIEEEIGAKDMMIMEVEIEEDGEMITNIREIAESSKSHSKTQTMIVFHYCFYIYLL